MPISRKRCPGDSLFTSHGRRGLPLGNQTSQFFANVYLNSMDHLVLRQLQVGEYARYVDDFVLFGDCKGELARVREPLVAHLNGLRLRLHGQKSRIYRTEDGLTFLGWRITPQGVRLKRDSVVRMRRRLRWMQREFAAGRMVEGCRTAYPILVWTRKVGKHLEVAGTDVCRSGFLAVAAALLIP